MWPSSGWLPIGSIVFGSVAVSSPSSSPRAAARRTAPGAMPGFRQVTVLGLLQGGGALQPEDLADRRDGVFDGDQAFAGEQRCSPSAASP
jgi:hypothetical protein